MTKIVELYIENGAFIPPFLKVQTTLTILGILAHLLKVSRYSAEASTLFCYCFDVFSILVLLVI